MLFKNKSCEKCGNKYDIAFDECPNCHQKDGNFKNLGIPKNILWLSQWQQIALFLVGFAFGGYIAFEILYASLLRSYIQDAEYLSFTVISLVYISIFTISILISMPRIRHVLTHFKDWDKYLYGVGYAITLIALSSCAGLISQYVLGAEQNINQSNVISFVKSNPFFSLLVVGVIGPMTEELCYRAGLYSFVRRLNKYVAFIVTITVFALVHLDFQADIVNELKHLPSYIVGGLIFCLAYEHKGPAASMTAHIIYNSVDVILILLGI